MTQEERDLIKKELLIELQDQYKIEPKRQDVSPVLADVRNKWFRDERKAVTNSIMGKAFGIGYVAWSSWENIRRLTCQICGVQYVRDLANRDDANEVCEALCQAVYDLAMKHRGKTDEEV